MLRKSFSAPVTDLRLYFHLLCRLVRTLFLLGLFSYLPVSAAAQQIIKDDQANRIVSGIISFTRWPALQQDPQLCVFPSAQHLSFPHDTRTAAVPFSVVWLNDRREAAQQRCDALYFGDESPQQQTELLASLPGKAVLTFAEQNPDCTRGAAFCLLFSGGHTGFAVNLDSLARSGVRVSPDVLLLSRKGSK